MTTPTMPATFVPDPDALAYYAYRRKRLAADRRSHLTLVTSTSDNPDMRTSDRLMTLCGDMRKPRTAAEQKITVTHGACQACAAEYERCSDALTAEHAGRRPGTVRVTPRVRTI